jgi:hypothetical protein
MSLHVEWAAAAECPAELIDEAEAETWTDSNGSKLDPGNVGLWVGTDDEGTCLEGTRAELAQWLRAALALVEQEAVTGADS